MVFFAHILAYIHEKSALSLSLLGVLIFGANVVLLFCYFLYINITTIKKLIKCLNFILQGCIIMRMSASVSYTINRRLQ